MAESQQAHAQEPVDPEEEASWLTYRPRRSDLTHMAPEIASLPDCKIGRSTPPVGLDALYYQQASAGIDTRLQFQWIRAHPAVAISQCIPSHERDVHSERSSGRKRRVETNSAVPGPDTACNSLLLPRISVDLTELVEPPLLSNWVPGSHTSVSYETDDEMNDIKPSHREELAAGNSEVLVVVDKLVDRAIEEVETEVQITTSRVESVVLEVVSTLSSSVLLRSIERKICATSEKKCGLLVSVKICSLCLLAENNPNKKTGKHILALLAPALMAAGSNLDVLDDHQALTVYQHNLIRRLADALIVACSLAEFPKRELRALMSYDQNSNFTSDALCELKSCIGESYHNQRR